MRPPTLPTTALPTSICRPGIPFTAGVLSFTPVLHLIIPIDDATKITKFDATTGLPVTKDAKLWGGVSIAWSKEYGAAPATDEAK